jgi:membrane fusion protein, copper/silver efflux system
MRNRLYSYFLLVFLVAFAIACNNNGQDHSAHQQTGAKELYTCPMPQDSFFSEKPGLCPKCGMELVKVEDHTAHADHGQPQQPAQYTCPMHPEIIRDEPGKCPICGMNLVPKESGGAKVAGLELESLLRPANEFVISSIPVTTIKRGAEIVEISALGRVEYDTRMTGTISSRVSGRIERLYVRYQYQPVQKGQKVLDIYSPELLTAQQNLIFLLQNDAENASLIQAAKQRLSLMGMSAAQIATIVRTKKPSYSVAIFSNYSGHLHNAGESSEGGGNMQAESSGGMGGASSGNFNLSTTPLNLKEGMYVQQGQNLFSVYNPARVWASLNIYTEGQSLVKEGQLVKIVPETAPTRSFQGKVDFIEPFYRQETKTLTVRVYFDNTKRQLPVGSQVRATIIAHTPEVYWLPKESVTSLGMDRVVFLKEQDGFRAKRIHTGIPVGDKLQVLSGLTEKDSVAANAQFLIDSESFIKAK